MRRVVRLSSPALVSLVLLLGGPAVAPASGAERLIVGYTPQASAAERSAVARAADVRRVRRLITGHEVVVAPSAAARQRLARDRRVRNVESDRRVTLAEAAPDDPAFSLLWGLRNTGQVVNGLTGTSGQDARVLEAWDLTRGAGVTVGVLDTGTDLENTDLSGNAWVNPGEIADNGNDDDANGFVDDVHGWNFVSMTSDVTDDHGHGTHVAGTALAVADNGLGIAGVAPDAKLLTLKVLDDSGAGWTSDIADAFEYAARQGARVVNASLSGPKRSSYLHDAIARHPGTLLVAAAGNDGVDVDVSPEYPCAYDLANVVCVAAHGSTGALASFSNRGATTVDLAAPGVNTLSWVPGGLLAYSSGTSMAAPHVTGAAALAAANSPRATPSAIREALVGSARSTPTLANTTVSGGALDAAALLSAFTIVLEEPLLESDPASTTEPEPVPESGPDLVPAPVTTNPIATETPVLTPLSPRDPAKLRLLRAGIKDDRLDMLAEITRRATGRLTGVLTTGGRRHSFSATIPPDGRVRIDRALPSSMRRASTGIVELTYAGSARVRPDNVRLRAARVKAELRRTSTTLVEGRLRVGGTIDSRAQGVVRIRLEVVEADAGIRSVTVNAAIRRGRWAIDERLTGAAARGGQLSIQFTGDQLARMRGEQTAKQVR